MHRIYANLLGNWTDITSDGLIDETEPITYFKEQIQDLIKRYFPMYCNEAIIGLIPTIYFVLGRIVFQAFGFWLIIKWDKVIHHTAITVFSNLYNVCSLVNLVIIFPSKHLFTKAFKILIYSVNNKSVIYSVAQICCS